MTLQQIFYVSPQYSFTVFSKMVTLENLKPSALTRSMFPLLSSIFLNFDIVMVWLSIRPPISWLEEKCTISLTEISPKVKDFR